MLDIRHGAEQCICNPSSKGSGRCQIDIDSLESISITSFSISKKSQRPGGQTEFTKRDRPSSGSVPRVFILTTGLVKMDGGEKRLGFDSAITPGLEIWTDSQLLPAQYEAPTNHYAKKASTFYQVSNREVVSVGFKPPRYRESEQNSASDFHSKVDKALFTRLLITSVRKPEHLQASDADAAPHFLAKGPNLDNQTNLFGSL